MNINDLYAEAKKLEAWTIQTRRALHRIPEAGFSEFKTQALIVETLDKLGIPYKTERTWVVADIKGDAPGPTVALRADIDALPVTEPEGCAFRSEHEGWMHACGHDCHTAILLAAARPEQGIDAIVCAAQIVTALQTVVSRNTSPLRSAVLSVGSIHGGNAPNVICDRVEMHGTLRTASPELRAFLKERIRAICSGIGAAFGATVEVEYISGYDVLINTPAETDRVLRLGGALLGAENALVRQFPSMGGEDFAYFVKQVPGAFWHLGCSASLPAPPLHSRDFVPDEHCLPIGVALQCALALDRMGALE